MPGPYRVPMPTTVAPLAIQHASSGFAITITALTNGDGPGPGATRTLGRLMWPETEDGRYTRDQIFASLPRTLKDLRRPLIATAERVSPGGDVEEVLYLPADVAETVLGCPLPEALANADVRGVPEALPLGNFEAAIEQGPGADPHGPAHQFHRTGFGSRDLQTAMGNFASYLAGVFDERRETWTDAVIVAGFVDVAHEGHRDTHPKMTAMMGNHAGAWPVGWNFGTDEVADLLNGITELREVTESEWNVLAVRLSRTSAKAEQIDTQVRGFPVTDVVGFLEDDGSMLALLGGVFPYEQG